MQPVVDRDLCTGCALCEDVCPEVFRLGDDGIAIVIDREPPHEEYDCVQEAVESCPSEAISVTAGVP